MDLRSLQRTSNRHISYWNKWTDKGTIYSRKLQRIRAKEEAGQRWSMSLFLVVDKGEAGRFL